MLETSLAPYLLWAKTRSAAAIDLAGSNMLPCSIDELPGIREALDIAAPNDNGYGPLMEAIAAHYQVPLSHVATAAGCSGANFLAIAAIVGPGDHVLVERPAYDPLIGACRLIGASVSRFDRRFENGYQIDVDDLRARITGKTRLIVLTTPHNPSGVSIGPDSLAEIRAVADGAGALVLVDEVYLDAAMLAGGVDPATRSAARLAGPMIVTNSLTKSYGLAGLRCGWVIARPDVAERVRRTRDVVDNAGSAPVDRLGAFAFAHLPPIAEGGRAILSTNLERARAFFDEHLQLELAVPPSASIVFPRVRGVTEASPVIQSLLERHGVAVAPGSFFDAPAHFRIGLVGRTDAVDRGLAALSQTIRDHVA